MAKRKRRDSQSTQSASPSAGKTRGRRFRVSLEHEATLDLRAGDEQQAWEQYKRARGILASDHVARIEELSS